MTDKDAIIQQLRERIEALEFELQEMKRAAETFTLPGLENTNLTRKHRQLLKTLHKGGDRFVSHDVLMSNLYADRVASGEIPDTRIVDVYVCKIRKAIAQTPWRIENFRGQGYRLVNTSANAQSQAPGWASAGNETTKFTRAA